MNVRTQVGSELHQITQLDKLFKVYFWSNLLRMRIFRWGFLRAKTQKWHLWLSIISKPKSKFNRVQNGLKNIASAPTQYLQWTLKFLTCRKLLYFSGHLIFPALCPGRLKMGSQGSNKEREVQVTFSIVECACEVQLEKKNWIQQNAIVSTSLEASTGTCKHSYWIKICVNL